MTSLDFILRRSGIAAAAVLVAAAVLSGCVSSPRFTTHTRPHRTETTEPVPVSGTAVTSAAPAPGAPAAPPAAERTAASKESSLLMTQGIASYYADEFHGRKTANGETYDMFDLTAAHRSLPFGTTLRVTNLDNQQSVVVRINDRGPFKMERIIDISLAAATQLQMMGVGIARVQLDVLEWGDNLYKK